MTAKEIARVIATSLFHFRRCVVVPNVSWGLLPWEADLLVLNASGYLYEVEIKTSIADLKRDSAKAKWTMDHRWDSASNFCPDLRAMWFAMPGQVWEHKDAAAAVPAHAGVIVVEPAYTIQMRTLKREVPAKAVIARASKPNKAARKLSAEQKFNLARLGTMRFWAQRQSAIPSSLQPPAYGEESST